ncbi:sensor histidine kinase [Streptomyces sp. NBC_00083]|uniref:sensor histidine kinase n=1 Tax=Streptomyces sp. NBC_00083 TaxID=2975647 RepID=UPI002258CE39|nr:sensor histidine kinase [Streptomyces sp. NBC_00083]MCX5382674.1 sensor histidine kinase [Streptomyces sp. NBC_00083]
MKIASLSHHASALLRPPPASVRPLFSRAPKRWQRWSPYVVAGGSVAALLPITITVLSTEYRVGGGWAGALGVAQTVPLVLAVARPLQAWLIVLCADVLGAVVMAQAEPAGHAWPWTPTVIIGYLLVMACLGLRETTRTLVTVWLVTCAAGLAVAVFPPDGTSSTDVLLLVLAGVVLAFTGAVRRREEAVRLLAEQETISEAERAQRTLLEERARIARELHDVVAHHMSVITVQADSAPYRLTGLDDAVRGEFASIASSARESLSEMRRLLAVLRSDGSGEDGAERAPQPGVDRIQQLVEATVRAGLPARLSLAADLPALAPAVDLSAYRIVQEALANVVRHAPGATTRVSVTCDERHLTVVVVNARAAERTSPLEASGTGHGLVGMRERVRLTGGSLDTGPLPDGGFRVAARLPLDTPDSCTEDPS